MTAGPVAVDEVVARFHTELRHFIARRVQGPDADAVLQDAQLRIHAGIGALRTQESLAPWVYRVARSAIIDNQRRRHDLPVEDPEPEALPEEPSESALEALSVCVTPFLGALPDDQAEALRLTDLGALTQAEAAAPLGVPLPTLKARVQRGRRALWGVFDPCCAFEQDARSAVVGYTSRWGCSPRGSPR